MDFDHIIPEVRDRLATGQFDAYELSPVFGTEEGGVEAYPEWSTGKELEGPEGEPDFYAYGVYLVYRDDLRAEHGAVVWLADFRDRKTARALCDELDKLGLKARTA